MLSDLYWYRDRRVASAGDTDEVRDHLPTVIAYFGVAVLVAVWFWRSQSGVVNPTTHLITALTFGLLWPVALPWRAAVHAVAGVIARYRSRKRSDVDISAKIVDPPR